MNALGCDAVGSKGSDVCLPMVPVIVNGDLAENTLLDSGSTNTFISESLASTLQLPGKVTSFNLSVLSQKGVKNRQAVSVHLSPLGGGDPVHVDNVLVTPGIPTRYPDLVDDTEEYPHLIGVPVGKPGWQCWLVDWDGQRPFVDAFGDTSKWQVFEFALRCPLIFWLVSAWYFSRLFRWCVCSLRENIN